MGYRLREYLVSLAAFYRSLASLSPRGTACLAIHLTQFHPLFCRQKRGGGGDVGRCVDRCGLWCGRRQLQTLGEISPGANELGQRESREL